MKEHIEFITDSFTDYLGKVHHFVIAALSQNLPVRTGQLEDNPTNNDFNELTYEVCGYIEDYGIEHYLGTVTKTLRLGIAICNPNDTFDENIGRLKAAARARNAKPALYTSNPGLINTGVVKALLQQEATYLKDNPENYIKGYADARDRYLTRQKMESMKNEFSEVENKVVEGIQDNPKFLDKVMEYLNWFRKQQC